MEMERLRMSGNDKMYSAIIRKALHHLGIFQLVFFVQFWVENQCKPALFYFYHGFYR